MSAALWFVFGCWTAALTQRLKFTDAFAPNFAALAVALLLLRSKPRRQGVRSVGLLLGFSTASLAPLGSWLLAGGLAGALIVPLRRLLYLESFGAQFLCGGVAALGFLIAESLYALGSGTALAPPSLAVAVPPLLTAAATPILIHVAGFARARARALAQWWAARRNANPYTSQP